MHLVLWLDLSLILKKSIRHHKVIMKYQQNLLQILLPKIFAIEHPKIRSALNSIFKLNIPSLIYGKNYINNILHPHTHMREHAPAMHAYIRTRAHTHTCTYTNMHTHADTRIHMHMHAYIQIYTHARTYTYTHTYIFIYIYIFIHTKLT